MKVSVPRNGENDPAYEYPIVKNPGVGSIRWSNDLKVTEARLKRDYPEVHEFRYFSCVRVLS